MMHRLAGGPVALPRSSRRSASLSRALRFGGWVALAVVGCSYDPVAEPLAPTPPTSPIHPEPTSGTVSPHPEVATILEVHWDQPPDATLAQLSWVFEGNEHRSPLRQLEAGPAREVVLGLPPEVEVDITLHLFGDGGEQRVALGSGRTGSLPTGLFSPTVTVADPGPGWWVTSVDVGLNAFLGPCYAIIVDRQGRVVWYRKTTDNRLTWQVQLPPSGGHLLIDQAVTYAFDYEGPATVARTTLDGREADEIVLNGMFVSYDALADGSFLFDAGYGGNDFRLARRWPDGRVEDVWACMPWIAGEAWADQTWACATNTVQYDEGRGTVLWSTFETHVVAEIDLVTGEVVRAYGPHSEAYPYEDPATAMTHQHFPGWAPDGRLLASTWSVDGERQHARGYVVDEHAGVLREVWSVESPHWAAYGGQVQDVGDGRYLWQLGTAGVIQEIDEGGTVLWALDFDGHLTGNVTPITDLYDLNVGVGTR